MSKAGREWSLKLEGLRPSHKLMLITLGDIHNEKTGKCFPKLATLARRVGVHKTQARKILAELEEAGLLTRVIQAGTTNLYLLPYMMEFEGEDPTQKPGGGAPDNQVGGQLKVGGGCTQKPGAHNTIDNGKIETKIEHANFSFKNSLGKIDPSKYRDYAPSGLSRKQPDYVTRCRWERGEWTEEEEVEILRYVKEADRKSLPPWLQTYEDHRLKWTEEMMRELDEAKAKRKESKA